MTEQNNNLNKVIDKLLYIVKKHELNNADELRKYIYTHNFKEDEIKVVKSILNQYDEMNIFNCVFFYLDNKIRNREDLVEKIKGIA